MTATLGPLISKKTLAAEWGISERAIGRLISSRQLPRIVIGNCVRIPRAAADDYIRARLVPAATAAVVRRRKAQPGRVREIIDDAIRKAQERRTA